MRIISVREEGSKHLYFKGARLVSCEDLRPGKMWSVDNIWLRFTGQIHDSLLFEYSEDNFDPSMQVPEGL